jgi:nucleoside-diphosphate-sugar epimerase
MALSAFITGATGFVGGNLARELHRQGWHVTALVRPGSFRGDIDDLPIERVEGDIVDGASIRRAMPANVDAVYHTAASTNVWSGNNDEQDRVNIGGTREVIEAAVEAGAARMVYTSSFTTWGFRDGTLTEDSPRSATSDWINYVRTKYIAETLVEEAVRKGRLDAVILNPAHILGPGDRHNWSKMLVMVDRGKLPVGPSGAGAFADVREVARAHIEAWHRGRTGARYLLGGEHAAFIDVIRMAGEILGRPVPSKTTPAWLLRALARANVMLSGITGREPRITPESAAMISHEIICDSSRARQELDYRFTPIRELVKDTIAWMKSARLLT